MRGNRYRKQVVYIDPDFIDLIPFFLKSREQEIGFIRECITRSDMKEAQRLGHGMKGAGSGYSYPEINRLGKRIEEAAKVGTQGRWRTPSICSANTSPSSRSRQARTEYGIGPSSASPLNSLIFPG